MPVHIPWDQVILHGPKVLDAATALWDKFNARPRPAPIDSHTEIRTQVAQIAQRLQMLEEAQAANAELVKSMAEQIQGLTTGMTELSRRTAIATRIACGAVAVAVVAVVIALVR